MASISEIFQHIQCRLFPVLTEEIGSLGEKDKEFVEIIALLPLGKFVIPYEWCGTGRPPEERIWIAQAFVAKSVYGFPTTEALIDALKARPTLRRLCGWECVTDIPHASTFSRAFAQFAVDQLPQKIHEAVTKIHCGPKLVGHISRDATAIDGREKPHRKPKPQPVAAKKRGRPCKGQERPSPPPKRLDVQPQRTLEQNLADLPTRCDVGCKRNSHGHQESWIGYKLHLDVIDGDIPISAVLTSASVNDSQVAIPLAQMSAQRVTSLYDLMDSAYDSPQIHAYSRQLGHVPIIDPNPRRGEKIPLEPASAKRFRERTAAERVNNRLKDQFGGNTLRVRGSAKVMCHLMFGLLAITAQALFRRLC